MFDAQDHDALRAALDAFQVAMFALELDSQDQWTVLCHNAHQTILTGRESDEVAGKRMDTLLPANEYAVVHDRQQECIRTRKPLRAVTMLTHRSGKVMHGTTLIPIIGRDGDVRRIIGNTVGLMRVDGNGKKNMLDEVTRLSAETAISLSDALTAVELRVQKGDTSPGETRFLSVFQRLSERALKNSLEIRERLQDRYTPNMASETFLKQSTVARQIQKLSEPD
ncbi:MAG: PAS domain-containing protein [Pseudomonadota bacterium]